MLRGAECDRIERESGRGWRAYLVAAEERELEFDAPDETAVFCPDCCAAEGFGEG